MTGEDMDAFELVRLEDLDGEILISEKAACCRANIPPVPNG